MYLFETILKKKWTGLCKQKRFEYANGFEEEVFRQLGLGGYKKWTGFVLLDVRKWVCWFFNMLCAVLLICAEFL